MSRILRKFFFIACMAIVLLALSACKEEKTYKIGVSQCSRDDWRSKLNDEIDREIMFHEDAEVEIRSADDSNVKQIADIRYFVDNGFDIIIVSPNEAAALTPVIREVYESGMPVIIFDRNILDTSYTARIGVDDQAIGCQAAHYARHMLGREGRSLRALEICGRPGSTPAQGRHCGFTEEFVREGGVIVASAPANWRKEEAIPIVDSLLDLHPDVNLIYAHNDRMAIGASEVARRRGRDDIRIIGTDAAPTIGIKAVADSVIDATFLYPTEGHRLIRTALDILKDKPYSRETILPASSAVDLSNADILLLQNEALNEETGKMRILKSQIDDYWARHSSQTSLFYASIVIIVLMLVVIFLILRAYWQRQRHQQILLEQNRRLEQQRDMQRSLNSRLEAATQSKLMFFTNVSHDLRTPLTLIAEPVSQLAEADNLTPRQHTLIKIADKNVRILKRLINQILDFRKYENDKLSLNLSEIDLGSAIAEWTDSFMSLALKRGLTLRLSVPQAGETPLTVAADAEKIERVFFNLLSNAFKYTPSGGSIDVCCGHTDDGGVFFSVRDTGQGISSRDLGNIFDRFYQADRVHPNGSGIGLSLSKAFVELHEGTISVESEPQRGSIFTVTLPARHVADTPAEVAKTIPATEVEAELGAIQTEPEIDEGKPLVLVIDDNRDIQKLLTELMAGQYNVITASDGSEGLRKAVKYVPDLIVCDVMMPVIDGLECCRRLKAEVSTSHIPVLMLTACSMDEQRVQGYDSGADGYISKPFSSAVLMARCASLIQNRKRILELWQKSSPAPMPLPEQGKPKPVPPAGTDIDNEFYSRFLTLLNAEMGNSELTVDTIASQMGLERTQFYRKIKSLTNFSPVELIRKLRLREGNRLLKTTDKSVSEIAYETGFSTPAYFTRCYREAFGETPTETRSKLSSSESAS